MLWNRGKKEEAYAEAKNVFMYAAFERLDILSNVVFFIWNILLESLYAR